MPRPSSAELAMIRTLSVQVWQLSSEIWSRAGPVIAELGLTGPLAELLWVLDPRAGPRSMRGLAEVLKCDASNMTFLADRLEERGLVERNVDPADRRVKLMTLTLAGAQRRDRLVEAVLGETPFGRLSQDERRQLHDLLAKALR